MAHDLFGIALELKMIFRFLKVFFKENMKIKQTKICNRDHMTHSLRYLLSGPSLNKFVYLCYM